jgi:DNA modification methylase
MYELILDDCFNTLRSLPAESVDLILTDPPYVIGTRGCGLAGNRKYLADITDAALDTGFDAIILEEFLRVLKVPNIIVFCSRLQIRDYLNWAHDRNLTWSLICWHKTNPTPLTNNNYLPDTEYILHFWRGRRLGGHYGSKRRYYVLPSTPTASQGHPTAKPLVIVKNLMLNAASSPGAVILDPFMGSGTTGVAAVQLGHKFIGIELNGDYLAIAKRRIVLVTPAAASEGDLRAA